MSGSEQAGLRGLDTFSGIGVASLAMEAAGIEVVAHAEIEPFPCAVLEHHWPGVPNLGDVTKIDGAKLRGEIDVLTGGWPCQDNSVAGKRAGHAGKRSGLFVHIVRLAKETQVPYMVLENVPGLLSVNDGKDMETVLDWLNEAGYLVDVDILDAQHMGVPQRRRRLFFACARPEALLSKRTPISESIAAELVARSLLVVWDALLQALSPEQRPLGYEVRTEGMRSSLSKRTQQLENLLGPSPLLRLHGFWGASTEEESSSAWILWESLARHIGLQNPSSTAGDTVSFPSSMSGESGNGSTSTESLQKRSLADLLKTENSSTISTLTSSITATETCTFARAMLDISESIIRWTGWSENSYQAASLLSTLLQEITEYAGQASSQIFTEPFLLDRWGDCERSASDLQVKLERHIREIGAGEILSISEGVQRHPAPSREKGQGVAALTAGGVGTCGADDNQGQAGHLLPAREVAPPIRSNPYGDHDAAEGHLVTHSLTGEGHDASEDGTGRGEPLVPHGFYSTGGTHGVSAVEDGCPASEQGTGLDIPSPPAVAFGGNRTSGPTEVSTSVGTKNRQDFETETLVFNWQASGADWMNPRPDGTDALHSGQTPAVAFAENQRGEVRTSECHPQSTAGGGKPGQGYPAVAFALRGREDGAQVEVSGEAASAIRGASGGSSRDYISTPMAVRRLTPLEAERLQGLPDGWTDVPVRKAAYSKSKGLGDEPEIIGWKEKPAADGPRYRALGNAWAYPVGAWVMKRIAAAHRGDI